MTTEQLMAEIDSRRGRLRELLDTRRDADAQIEVLRAEVEDLLYQWWYAKEALRGT